MKTNFRELRIYDLFPVLTIFFYFWRPKSTDGDIPLNYKDTNYCAYEDKKQQKFSKGHPDRCLCLYAGAVRICAEFLLFRLELLACEVVAGLRLVARLLRFECAVDAFLELFH